MPLVSADELEQLKKADKKLKERYRKQNEHTNTIYDRLNFTVPAGKKAEIEQAAKKVGLSVNAFCSKVVLAAVEDEIGQTSVEMDRQEEKDNKQPFVEEEIPECFRD